MISVEKMDKIIEKYNSYSLAKYREHISSVKTETLIKIKDKLDNRYYNTGEPVIEDERYDLLVDLLEERGETLKVGCKLREGDNKTSLPFYLGGMDKIKKGEDSKITKWLSDNKCGEYIVSDKLNGVSCLVVYDKDGVINLYTRGDCTEGADVSYLADKIPSIVKGLKNIAIRGEFIISIKDYNDKHTDKENCLSTIVGLINSKTLRKGVKDLVFIAYEIVEEKPTSKPSDNLERLRTLGFNVARYEVFKEVSSNNLGEALERRKGDSLYEIDGVVVQGNVPYNRHNLASSGNPDYAFAFKMILEVAEVVVEDVEWNIKRYGAIKPRIRVIGLDGKPVKLTGITIRYSSGFNAAYIHNNKINKGSRLLITRSGDIIPYVLQVLTQSHEGRMPDYPYNWNESGVDIYACERGDAELIQKLVYFFTTLGVKYVNEGVVKRFVKAGLDSVLLILEASKEDFEEKVDGFKGKMAEKIWTSIHATLENVDVPVLMAASGVFGFGLGVKRATIFCNSLDPFGEVDVDDVAKIEGFSTKTAERLVKGLADFRDFVDSLRDYIRLQEVEEKLSNDLAGKKYVFSGFRDKELEERITKNGGTVSSSVSSKTTALIVATLGETSSKVSKAISLGVQIIERGEF
jgi:NAD-dependent DNA ligase